MHLRAEDSGEYTLRAINRWGEVISTSTLNVIGWCFRIIHSVTQDIYNNFPKMFF